MLKLRFLFNNETLAAMILENWKHDPDSGEMLKNFRISSNAVYPFKSDGRVCFLRFAPVSEKDPGQVAGELEFIEYLKQSGYNAPAVIPSTKGSLLEIVKTPWGEYEAAAFKGVPGRQLDGLEPDEAVICGYGRALGRLHRLSAGYSPKLHKRWSWQDALAWVLDVLSGFPNEEAAVREAGLLEEFFSKLPAEDKNYGLIHYDFETDNVFFEKEKLEYHIIDFDDAMYHWYAMDIDQALDSLTEDMEPMAAEHFRNSFIEGYRSQYDITDDMLALLPVFRRFANLYGYARILRSTCEAWENEPEWMRDLRRHLDMLRVKRSAGFGKPIGESGQLGL